MNPWTVRIDYGLSRLPPSLPQHADEHRPQRPVLLALDQQFGEGVRVVEFELRSRPVLSGDEAALLLEN
jgi:hypothetical protein